MSKHNSKTMLKTNYILSLRFIRGLEKNPWGGGGFAYTYML